MSGEIVNCSDEIAIAYDPINPSDLLTLKDDGTLTLYASHPRTNPEVLRVLAQREDLSILRAIAGNPSTPEDVLDTLAHSWPSVCKIVAKNPTTMPETLTWLLARSLEESKDDWKECRFNVLSNPHTPVSYILEKMLDQMGERSRLAIRTNSSFKSLYSFAIKQDEKND